MEVLMRYFFGKLLYIILFMNVTICYSFNVTLNRSDIQEHIACCNVCRCEDTEVFCDGVALRTLPLDCPQNTTLLSLAGCGINELKDGDLGQNYKHLQSLNISGNRINMKRKTFDGLQKLQVLNIGTNVYSIKDLHPLVFQMIPNIKYIEWTSLGDRTLERGVETVMNTFQGLENSSIETIILKNMNQYPFFLKKSHLKYLRNSPIKQLVLYRFYLTEFDVGIFQYIPHIEEIDFSMNNLQMPELVPSLVPYLFFKLTKLKGITATDNLKRKSPRLVELLTKEQAKTVYPFPKTIEFIDISRSVCSVTSYLVPYGIKFQSNNRLKKVNFSNVKLFRKVSGKILGFVQLKEANLQGGECEIQSSVWSCEKGAFESLEILNIARNYIKWASTMNKIEGTFINCTRLRILDMSYNSIDHVPSKLLKDAVKLRSLNLSGNNLNTLNFELHGLTSLKMLNVSNNKLETLPKRMQQEINIINTNQSLVIDIGGNPLVCGCHSFEFIYWMQKNRKSIHQWENLQCKYHNDKLVHMHTVNILTLKLSCWRNVIIAGTVPSGVILLTMFVVILSYKRRYKLQYLYLQLRAAIRYHGKKNLDQEYNFDGFISYSSLDKTWGQKTLYAKLVGVYNYRICIDDHNFRPGGYISDIILDAINRSKKVILIISQNFLRSRWCAYEMNLARGELANRGRDCLILILKEPISVFPPELISPTLRSLLDTRVYLEWSEDADKKAVFWRKLCDALGEPRPQQTDVQHIVSPFLTAQTAEDEQMIQNFVAQGHIDNDERPLL
ncbi:unnamed protein product [Owenia fusiformis]|uniref:Uncharacterized protein n=1 Tax=Owenia fusiformis TaxID=6347 RepID=A0A8J1XV87_OWEFU|nr:unnamed protein product [Owenia fusiformis]